MKIVIENQTFPYDIGCRLLKLKYEKCPFPRLEAVWDDIKPMSFAEIAEIENIEQRRVGVVCLGIERLAAEVNPQLLDRQVIKKETTWVLPDGKMEVREFDDVYELYEVEGKYFDKGITHSYLRSPNCHFVKCKDTSTNREYFIWVDLQGVFSTNYQRDGYHSRSSAGISEENKKKINAIQCIAWTIQTNVPEGQIEKIIRQGDCIMIKKKAKSYNKDDNRLRHLSEKEYRELLIAES